MTSFGGYFELELRRGEEYHKNAHRLNTGRNALELILRTKKYKKVYIPYYTCDAILEPFDKLIIDYEFYYIDKNFEPLFNYNNIKENEGFLYTNYFGLKDEFVCVLSQNCKNLIIDNSQAFYSLPKLDIPTFYSCRKFFGVPDGAYLYLDDLVISDYPVDVSFDRTAHLLKRHEFGAEIGFKEFKESEQNLVGQPIKQMSSLTKAILCNIDYSFIRERRRNNFQILNKHLSEYNKLNLLMDDKSVPMVYPFLHPNKELKNKLIENKIFVATYWPNVFEWTHPKDIEYSFVEEVVYLPIDQRMNLNDIHSVITTINKFL